MEYFIANLHDIILNNFLFNIVTSESFFKIIMMYTQILWRSEKWQIYNSSLLSWPNLNHPILLIAVKIESNAVYYLWHRSSYNYIFHKPWLPIVLVNFKIITKLSTYHLPFFMKVESTSTYIFNLVSRKHSHLWWPDIVCNKKQNVQENVWKGR